jgi:hypothetical protein
MSEERDGSVTATLDDNAAVEAGSAGSGAIGGQRFGHITDRKPSGSGPSGRMGTYFVRDDETGEIRSFDYSDIVTEGFRTIRTGERVRYLTDSADLGRAVYVIRLDLPDPEQFYR